MGFRSTFVSDHYSLVMPQWFKDKYQDWLNCDHLPLSSKWETKTYGDYGGVCEDFQKVLQELTDPEDVNFHDKYFVNFIWLHECGGVTKVRVNRKEIIYLEPEGWGKSDGITHHYCDCN